MRCRGCRAKNPKRALFCHGCGIRLAVVCQQCHTRVPVDSNYCFECGAALKSAGTAPANIVQTGVGREAGRAPQAQPAVGSFPPANDLPLSEHNSFSPDGSLLERLKRLAPTEYADKLLAARGQVAGERRMVTILFSDVKGSTHMAEKLDPEDVMEIMNGAFERLIAPIYRHEGTLARLMGDAILAFFGAPIAHEDDPQRAVRAALEIINEVQAYAAQLEQERGIQDFNVRVGINTGLVVMGEVGSDLRTEYTAMGDAINLAARMEQNAPVGGVLISQDTWRLVQGDFDLQALPPVQVKGKSEPIQVYQVRGVKGRSSHEKAPPANGMMAPMMGRQTELNQLQDALHLALEGERQMVTVIGEAGIGKSRLLKEFTAWLEGLPHKTACLRGRAASNHQNTPYALLRDLISHHFGIFDDDPPAQVLSKLERCLSWECDSETPGGLGEHSTTQAHFIGALLGFNLPSNPSWQTAQSDPQQLHDRALLYLGDYFKKAEDQQPVVLLLEDLHWADDSSLEAINQLARELEDQRILLIVTARPALLERRPRWGEGQNFHTRLRLHPLSRLDCRRMAEALMEKIPSPPAELRDLVASGAEGNPLYVEELVKMLIEDGVILLPGADQPAAPWQVDLRRLANLRLPPTLMGVLQARLDALHSQERETLQRAAVIGRVFWDRAIERMAGAEAPGEVDQALDKLRQKEMVFHREISAFAEAQEYIFKHALLREAAYESLLKRVRRELHAQAAAWLIEESGERQAEFSGLIAEHLEMAGLPTQALDYLRQAGRQAAARYANEEAVFYLSRALQLLPETDSAGRSVLLLEREQVYERLGSRPAQAADLEQLEALAGAGFEGDPQALRLRAEIALRRAALAEAINDYPAAIRAAQLAFSLARAAGQTPIAVQACFITARSLSVQTLYSQAIEQIETGLPLARAAGDLCGESDLLLSLALICQDQGNHPQAETHLKESLQLARQANYRRGESITLNALGNLNMSMGNMEDAETFYEQSLRMARELGNRASEGITLGNLGSTRLARGDYSGALAFYEQTQRLARQINYPRLEANNLNNISATLATTGSYAGALQTQVQAQRIQNEIGDRYNEGIALSNLGWIACRLGDLQAAEDYCQRSLDNAREVGSTELCASASYYLGNVLLAQSQPEKAQDTYRDALQGMVQIGNLALACEARAGLAQALLAGGDPNQAQGEVEAILAYLTGDSGRPEFERLEGASEPILTYLACYRVLQANQDARAGEILKCARQQLDACAARITDPAMRQNYLENVPFHREVLELTGF